MLNESELMEEQKNIDNPNYTSEEMEYLKRLQTRLEFAKRQRDDIKTEFDGLSLEQYWLDNEQWANTFIKPKENKGDITYQSGAVRKKMMSILSYLQGFNLSPDVLAFDEQDILVSTLGNAIEDVIDKTYELEGDEEKRMLRQYELLKHGSLFVEDVWNEMASIEKTLLTKKYEGQFRGVKWLKKEDKIKLAEHNNISMMSMYLGDISQYNFKKQPYFFTVKDISYGEAQRIYGGFEMFQFVSKVRRQFSGSDLGMMMVNNAWRLNDVGQDRVEVIKYSSIDGMEYQVILNGVPMLPVLGFPFPWGYDSYNVCQQNFEPIRESFAYGRSFVATVKANVGLFDEMVKLALLKDQKSYKPPYLNVSGQVVTSKVLDAGRITMGIAPGTLVPVSDHETQGMTIGEFNMIDFIKRSVDEQSVSQTFTGQGEKGDPTATQIMELQRQAKIMMGLVVLGPSLLEQKLAELRLMNILKNWFEPVDSEMDEARDVIKNKYRTVSRERMIKGEGMGRRFVVASEQKVTPQNVADEEKVLKAELGYPVRLVVVSPSELKKARYTWFVNVKPKDKRTSELSRLMFKQMVVDATEMGLTLDQDYVSQRFAEAWEEDAGRLFSKAAVAPVQQSVGTSGQSVVPSVQPGGATPMSPAVKGNIKQPSVPGMAGL